MKEFQTHEFTADWTFVRFHYGSRGHRGNYSRTELEEFCAQTDFLDRDEVMRYVERRDGTRVWYLLNLALWWKEYVRA